MSEEKKNLGAASSDDTSALFVTARKKQLAEQEAQRKAAEEEAKRQAAEAEVRRLEAEVAARKRQAEEEARRLAAEAEERRRQAEADALADEKRIAAEAAERRRQAAAAQYTQPAAPASPMPPKAPDKAAAPDKKKIAIIAGAVGGVVLIALIIILIVAFAGGSKDSGYQPWVEPLTMSMDEYNELSSGKQEKVIACYDEIIQSEYGISVLIYDEVNETLAAQTGSEVGSLALAVFDYCGMDGRQFILGDTASVGTISNVLNMSRNDFTGSYFTYKLGAVSVAMIALIDNGDISDVYSNVQVTADLFDQMEKEDADDYDEPGSFFKDLCKLFDLEPEATYESYQDNYADVPDVQEEDDNGNSNEATGFTTYQDDYSGVEFTYTDNLTLEETFADSASEIATLYDAGSMMMLFDITDDYTYTELSIDELLSQAMNDAAVKYFAKFCGEEAVSMETLSEVDSFDNENSVAYQTYQVNTETTSFSCLVDLRNLNQGDMYTLAVMFMHPNYLDNLSSYVTVLESLHMYSVG